MDSEFLPVSLNDDEVVGEYDDEEGDDDDADDDGDPFTTDDSRERCNVSDGGEEMGGDCEGASVGDSTPWEAGNDGDAGTEDRPGDRCILCLVGDDCLGNVSDRDGERDIGSVRLGETRDRAPLVLSWWLRRTLESE